MTCVAARVDHRERIARMARRARRHRMFARQRQLRRPMIERRIHPIHRRVTCLTLLAEVPRTVDGIVRLLVIALVARIAAGIDKRVVVIHMAGSASRRCVFSRQRKPRCRVVEGCS